MLLTAIEEEFGVGPGQTTPDGQLTVEVVYCLGSCALAPMAVLDEEVIGRVQRESLLRRIRKQLDQSSSSDEVLST